MGYKISRKRRRYIKNRTLKRGGEWTIRGTLRNAANAVAARFTLPNPPKLPQEAYQPIADDLDDSDTLTEYRGTEMSERPTDMSLRPTDGSERPREVVIRHGPVTDIDKEFVAKMNRDGNFNQPFGGKRKTRRTRRTRKTRRTRRTRRTRKTRRFNY